MQNWPYLFKVLLACKSSYLVLVLAHILSGRDGGSWCLKYLFNSCLPCKHLTVLILPANCVHLAQVSVLLEGRAPPSAAPAPPEGWAQGEEPRGALRAQLCLLQGWPELCAPLGTGWVPSTRQPVQVCSESQPAAWQGHQTLLRTAETQGWAQLCLSLPAPRCGLCSFSKEMEEPVVTVLMFACSSSCPALPHCWRGSPGSSSICFFWVGWPHSGRSRPAGCICIPARRARLWWWCL